MRFGRRLAETGPRVLKPHRGNDGQGVMKVEALSPGPMLKVQHASDDRVERLTPDELAERVRPAFDNGGRVIDQAFQPNAAAGMVRCYMSLDRVVGFAEQQPRTATTSGDAPAFGMNSSKTMHGPDTPALRDLRDRMERDWVPGLLGLLDIQTNELPALWDADFLVRAGPEAETRGRHVLCEINVSCVSPFPDGAPAAVATATRRGLLSSMGRSS